MAKTSLSWKFPVRKFLVLRIEAIFVGLLALLTFTLSLYQFKNNLLISAGFTLLFLALYGGLSFLIQNLRGVKEHYTVTPKHLEIMHHKKDKITTEKAPLKDFAKHKLDRTFLGGYVITRKGKKHLLFFNTKQELERFELFLKKHLKY